MSWLIAILAVVTAQGDGGTSSSVPTFHEPMTRPVPMKPIDWRLPFELRQRGVTGLVILACVLSEEGVVEECEVVKPVEAATDWAIAKVKSTRYTPVTLDGKPVRVRYVYNVRITGRGAPVESVPPTRWRPVVPKQMAETCRGSNAAKCHEVALSLLRPDAGGADLDRAARLLGAACEAGHEPACAKLERAFVAPALLQHLPQPSFPVASLVEGYASCLVSPQGRGHDCIVEPSPLSEWVRGQLPGLKFSPATYEGTAFETEHGIHYVLYPRK
ncbi:MAG TPA: energy transducer TonB [Myxococcaceae bacterium]|nr:energy transducer TonB [Myxococcaceae bacterium]